MSFSSWVMPLFMTPWEDAINLGVTFCYKNLVQFQGNTSILYLIQNSLPPAQVWPCLQDSVQEGGWALFSHFLVWDREGAAWHLSDGSACLGGGPQPLPAPQDVHRTPFATCPTLNSRLWSDTTFLGHHLWALSVSWLSALLSTFRPWYISLLLELIYPR